MRVFRGRLLTLAGVMAVFGGLAEGAPLVSLVLTSQSGGQYDYAIEVALNHGLVFNSNDEILLTGLSGVAGASVLPALSVCFSSQAITAASAIFLSSSACPVFDPVPMVTDIGTLRILSTALSPGPVSYQIQTGNLGTLSGIVIGPVGAPEPGTCASAAVFLLILLLLQRNARRRCKRS